MILVHAVIALFVLSVGPQKNPPARLAVVGAHVVDVESGSLLRDRTVIVEGGRIAAVGPRSSTPVPDGAGVVDGSGRCLLPGLFDAHVHLFDPATMGPLLVANGVTAARDMGAFAEQAISTRASFAEGAAIGPDLFVTGPLLDGPPPTWPVTEICETPEKGRAAVRRLAELGVDQIKVYSRLSKETYLSILDEARSRGLKVVGHVPEAVTLTESLAAGQASNEHLLAFGPEIARLAGADPAAKRNGISTFEDWAQYGRADRGALARLLKEVKAAGQHQCPTLVVLERLTRMDDPAVVNDPKLGLVPEFVKGFWRSGAYRGMSSVKRVLPEMRSFVRDLHECGVPLLAGTDLGNPYLVAGYSLHDELQIFASCGIPPADVLRAATIVPARFLGVEERLGSIAPGKTASMVLVRGNPLEDVRAAAEVEEVFLRGRRFSRADLDLLLADVRARASGGAASAESPAESRMSVPELELPGEVVARGRFRLRFRGADAGWEDFVVTRDEGGYRIGAHTRPSGGYDAPSAMTLETGSMGEFKRATYRQIVAKPVLASYSIDEGALVARAKVGGEDLEPARLPLPEGALVGGSSYASEFATLRTANLSPGERREYQLVSFGFSGWKPVSSRYVLERKEDEKVRRADGSEISVCVHVAELESPMGKIAYRVETDGRGIPVGVVITLPFGTFEAALE